MTPPPPASPPPSSEAANHPRHLAAADGERRRSELRVHQAAEPAAPFPPDLSDAGGRQALSAGQTSTAVLVRRAHARPKRRPEYQRVDHELFLPDSGRHEAAGRILGAALICFALWTLFDANQLYRSALSSPQGVRRTVSLTIVRPVAALSNALGLSLFVNWGDHMLGRGSGTPGGGPYTFPAPVITVITSRPELPRLLNGSTPRPHVAGAGTLPPPPPPSGLPPLPPPTAAHPLTILAIGDSIGQDLGYGLGETFTGRSSVKVIEKAVESTGLARPDYYNWPGVLQLYLRRYHPGAVVVMMGANDDQALDENGHFVPLSSRAWTVDYTSRVALLMEEAYAAGARVLWVGLPPMSSPNVSSSFAQKLNAIVKTEAAAHPGVTYFPSWPLLSGPGGRFTQYIRVNGNETQIRYPDGVHLTPEGWNLLGAALVHPMEQAWGVRLP